MYLVLSIACWFVASCIAMSFIEYFVHRFLMHKRILPLWCYTCIPGLGTTFTNHHVLHHGRYYKIFNHEEDPTGRRTSIRLDLWVGVLGAALVGLALYPLTAVAGPVFVCVILLHHLAWNLIHEEMHNPRPRWFAHTRTFQFFVRYHWMHHRYPGRNYNVVFPGADFLFRRHARPTAEDRLHMRAIGIGREAPAPEPAPSCSVVTGINHEHHGDTV
jgi:hypothetical protein